MPNDPPLPADSSAAAPAGPARWRRRLRLWGVPLVVALLLGVAAGIGFAAVIHTPKVDTLADFEPSLITRVADRDGEGFAFFARERRMLLDEGDVPELLQNAVLAAEDANFLAHGGVDAQGVLRALFQNVLRGRRAMGGSTITMQLARRLFLTPQKSWRRKIEEAFLAVDLEKSFSKEQILTFYCNMMYLGHGYYGMESASRAFFGKGVQELTLPEAATLAGILQRPSAYSPYRRPDLVLSRRDYVLRRMLEERHISREEYEAATAQPLEVVGRRAERPVAPYFAEEVRKDLEQRYGTETLLDKGLQVETTLDRAIQAAAERAVRAALLRLDHAKGWRGPIGRAEGEDLTAHHLPAWDALDPAPEAWNQGLVVAVDGGSATVRIAETTYALTSEGISWTRRRRPSDLLAPGDVAWFRLEPAADATSEPVLMLEQEPELEAAALVIESASGAVRAMVGGWSFERSKFNRATQARRQLGSAFKPFVLGAALEMGYTPADTLFDSPVGFPPGAPDQPPYSPRNYYRRYHGIITLRSAVERSINVTMVKLLDLIGAERAVDFAHRAGIRSELFPYPSLALGSADLIPLEVASAYAAIANQGVYVEPYLLERVTAADGRILEEHRPTARRAMAPEVAYVLTHTLEGVVDRGTARSAAGIELDLAGKTGTTDDYSDAWFVGFSPRYTVLTWVGYDVKRPIGREMTGAAAALPIWREILQTGLDEGWLTPGERFVAPPGVVFQAVEAASGFLAGPGAQNVIEEAFVDGTQPVLGYDPSWNRILQLPWYQQRSHYVPKAGERMPEDFADWETIEAAWEEEEEERRHRDG